MSFLRNLARVWEKPSIPAINNIVDAASTVVRAPVPTPRIRPRRPLRDIFQESDMVTLSRVDKGDALPLLRGPLTASGQLSVGHEDRIAASDIIGQLPRSTVRSFKAKKIFRINEVSLDEYVRLSPRMVTPIYPSDANVIVSLFDIHMAPPGPATDGNLAEPKFEILDSGTGHGCMTMHLSRAIFAGNPARQANETEEKWRASRQAVVHSVERNAEVSRHAQSFVQKFRRGIYYDAIEWHINGVEDWIQNQFDTRGSEAPFLSHAFVDMPAIDERILKVAEAVLPSGKIIVFCPHITQIMSCIAKTVEAGQHNGLWLEKVLELGNNASTGGREWDVRPLRPKKPRTRASVSEDTEQVTESDGRMSTAGESGTETETPAADQGLPPRSSSEPQSDRLDFLCRPKVGERIAGGGFLAVWTKRA